MSEKNWELFEENATKYLNSNIQVKNFSFLRSGGANSNTSDISVNLGSKNIFSIECKLKTSQAAQFVVFNDVENSIFFDSAKNKGKKDRRTPIIEHMNNNYNYYVQNIQSFFQLYNNLHLNQYHLLLYYLHNHNQLTQMD